MGIGPKMEALLKKCGQDVIDELVKADTGILPALIEQIEIESPAGAQATEALIFGVLQGAGQAALQSAAAQVKL